MIYVIVNIIICMTLAFVIAEYLAILMLLNRIKQLIAMLDENAEPTGEGMNLMLLKPRKTRKARRFTDKSQDWITARESASRR